MSELTAFAARGGYDVVSVFKETASGASANRLARNRVLDLAQARHIDAILVSELSRWGRSTQDLLETLNKLAGWKVLDLSRFCATPSSRLSHLAFEGYRAFPTQC